MDRIDTKDIQACNTAHVFRPYADPNVAAKNRPLIIEDGHGAIVTDIDGKQ